MIKKGLKVKILTGKDKNKEGEVIEIDRSSNRAKVKEINMLKKLIKTNKEKNQVDDLVDKEVKPIIKKWIDKNLRTFVKNIVVEEMKSISKATQKPSNR